MPEHEIVMSVVGEGRGVQGEKILIRGVLDLPLYGLSGARLVGCTA